MNQDLLRRTAAALSAALTLWTAVLGGGSATPGEALANLSGSAEIAKTILRWELGDYFGTDTLSAVNVLALGQSPLLLHQRTAIAALLAAEKTPVEETPPAEETPSAPALPAVNSDDLTFADNSMPAQTVLPTSTKGYTMVNGVYVKNTSSRKLDAAALGQHDYSARFRPEGPQVLILHSHATEAYAMPEGQSYQASGTYRTRDTNYNMVRIGDEIAAVLSSYGISVLHDRTLHDAASYNDAYDSSLASTKAYLEKYPSLTYVLDVHRDAIQDTEGKQYKLVTKGDSHVAQCCLVMGLSPDTWQENLKLAVHVQETLDSQFPTLMRPVAARGYRYNQHLSPGSLLVEIGAAGNSLDEAIMGARHFAHGYAATILASAEGEEKTSG